MGSNNRFNHTIWMAVDTPTDRPKSFFNHCVIELFVLSLCFLDFFVGVVLSFCHRTESDLFLFLPGAFSYMFVILGSYINVHVNNNYNIRFQVNRKQEVIFSIYQNYSYKNIEENWC